MGEDPMAELVDRALARQFERLEWLFALTEPRCFAEHALLAMLDAAEAPTGYVVLHPEGGAAVVAAARGRQAKRMKPRLQGAALAFAVCARLDDERTVWVHGQGEAPGQTPGEAQGTAQSDPQNDATTALATPIGAGALVSVRIDHGEAHCLSLWVLGREAPFDDAALAAVRSLAPAVGHLGALMLPRLPGGVATHYARSALAACDAPPALRPGPHPLDGLPRIAADCARLAARGYTNRQIGGYLLMAESVVARYLTLVYRHLEIEGRYQLDAERLLAGPKPAPRTPHDPRPHDTRPHDPGPHAP
jgi:hypothetical protein